MCRAVCVCVLSLPHSRSNPVCVCVCVGGCACVCVCAPFPSLTLTLFVCNADHVAVSFTQAAIHHNPDQPLCANRSKAPTPSVAQYGKKPVYVCL